MRSYGGEGDPSACAEDDVDGAEMDCEEDGIMDEVVAVAELVVCVEVKGVLYGALYGGRKSVCAGAVLDFSRRR